MNSFSRMNTFSGKFLRSLALCLLLPLAGCKNTTGEPNSVALETLYQHGQCGGERTASAILIDNAEALSEWWQVLARMTLPAPQLPAPLRQVDWREHNIVIIQAGSQPSAGYALNLADNTANVEEQTLIINVRLEKPPRDAMVAQVITSPCMAVAAAKGSYNAVKVKDSEGSLFTSSE